MKMFLGSQRVYCFWTQNSLSVKIAFLIHTIPLNPKSIQNTLNLFTKPHVYIALYSVLTFHTFIISRTVAYGVFYIAIQSLTHSLSPFCTVSFPPILCLSLSLSLALSKSRAIFHSPSQVLPPFAAIHTVHHLTTQSEPICAV